MTAVLAEPTTDRDLIDESRTYEIWPSLRRAEIDEFIGPVIALAEYFGPTLAITAQPEPEEKP